MNILTYLNIFSMNKLMDTPISIVKSLNITQISYNIILLVY
jgi:hypothetical protein